MDNEPSQAAQAPANEGAAIQQGNAPQDNGGAGDNGANTTPSPSSNGGTSTAADTTTAGFSTEQLAEMKKFFDNNGGFDAVKSKLSNPQKQPEPQMQQPQAQPQAQQPQMQQPEPVKAPAGYRTQQEIGLNYYLNTLKNSAQYEPIREYMEKDNGEEFFKDLEAFNIPVMDNLGNINVDGINRWLGVKLQTVPAKQPAGTPSESPAPTVDYVQVGEEIKSAAEAEAVVRQTAALKAQGLAPHPANAKAIEFLKKAYTGNKR